MRSLSLLLVIALTACDGITAPSLRRDAANFPFVIGNRTGSPQPVAAEPFTLRVSLGRIVAERDTADVIQPGETDDIVIRLPTKGNCEWQTDWERDRDICKAELTIWAHSTSTGQLSEPCRVTVYEDEIEAFEFVTRRIRRDGQYVYFLDCQRIN